MKPRNSMLGILIGSVIAACGARAGDSTPILPAESNLVKQANAPISNILQIRVQDTYVPRFTDLHGQGNTFAMAVTMPLPAYRLLPLPQLSLLSIPTAVTLPAARRGPATSASSTSRCSTPDTRSSGASARP